jgi:hypothetical protein
MSTTSSHAADRAYITAIDSQIVSFKESIQALEAQKLRAQERLNSYAYPVLTLPNEIVSEIFVIGWILVVLSLYTNRLAVSIRAPDILPLRSTKKMYSWPLTGGS